jgi:probable phosphoglycerate mutase
MALLYLARHGETDWNRERRLQGQTDIPLNEAGRTQARALGARLRSVAFSAAYSSDALRAQETAEIVVTDRSLVVVAVPDLRERHYGRWEGHRVEDVMAADPESWHAWQGSQRDRHAAPHGGESDAQIEDRLNRALGDIAASHADEAVLVVSHGGVIGRILSRWLETKVPVPANCETYVVEVAGDARRLVEKISPTDGA